MDDSLFQSPNHQYNLFWCSFNFEKWFGYLSCRPLTITYMIFPHMLQCDEKIVHFYYIKEMQNSSHNDNFFDLCLIHEISICLASSTFLYVSGDE